MSKLAISSLASAVLVLSTWAGTAQSPPAEAPARSFTLPPLDELRATRERPLFSPLRKPDALPVVTEVETPVTQEAPESVPFELTGIVMGEDRAVAILHNRETQETVHLRQGETADVWSVAEIAPRHVVLRSDGRQVRLELFEPKPEGAGNQPPVRNPELNFPRPRRNSAQQQQPTLRRSGDRQPRRRINN